MSKEKTPPATIDVGPENVTDCKLRRRRYGIYEIAYEDDTSTPQLLSARPLLDGLWQIRESAPYAQALLSDILKLAPGAFITYMMTTVWRSVSSAINIYFLSLLFNLVSHSIFTIDFGSFSVAGRQFYQRKADPRGVSVCRALLGVLHFDRPRC
jgi:hypothetical protein